MRVDVLLSTSTVESRMKRAPVLARAYLSFNANLGLIVSIALRRDTRREFILSPITGNKLGSSLGPAVEQRHLIRVRTLFLFKTLVDALMHMDPDLDRPSLTLRRGHRDPM